MYGTIEIQRLIREKIIQADVKLEETDIELESLELANKEMNDTLYSLEKEVDNYTSPSLHSIHSEDLMCLSKIRQLAKEELCLKNCIRELELKETLFKEQMDRLLTSRDYQSVCGRRKITSCLQDVDCREKKICCISRKCLLHKPSDYRLKKKHGQNETDVFSENERTQTQRDATVSTSEHSFENKQNDVGGQRKLEGKTERKYSWMPSWWSGNQKMKENLPSTNAETITLSNAENNESQKSTTIEVSIQSPNPEKGLKDKNGSDHKPFKPRKIEFTTPSCKPCGHAVYPHHKFILPCNTPCNKPFKDCSKSTVPPRKPFYELPHDPITNYGVQKARKPFVSPCDLESPCEICPWMSCKNHLRSDGNCRRNCKDKCARRLSDVECNCSDVLLDLSDEYQPSAFKLYKDSHGRDSNSDDEFCECCSCGCEDSDASFAYQCN
ncbi:uncharacterized protein LOC143145119 isoform X2 [Ptiloglossa arizonensis]|uniref:uncharacterized protein LOC143145119 isoform X2 n=1 Tax=Ptiloglossa arizonensis TaxID=3350558 RepID=UPI003FA067F6